MRLGLPSGRVGRGYEDVVFDRRWEPRGWQSAMLVRLAPGARGGRHTNQEPLLRVGKGLRVAAACAPGARRVGWPRVKWRM